MAFFEINFAVCTAAEKDQYEIEKQLSKYARRIGEIEQELGKIPGFENIQPALAQIREELYNEKKTMGKMREVLHDSIQCYKDTEEKLSRMSVSVPLAVPTYAVSGNDKGAESLQERSIEEKKKDSGKEEEGSGDDSFHSVLDCLGLIPGIGALFDGINACSYACEGRWGEALLSGLALVPVAGVLAGAGKVGGKAGMKAISHADDIKNAVKGLDKLDDAVKGLNKLDDAADIVKHGDEVIKGGSKTGLLDELANSGVKYNPDDVVAITKNADGKLVWLEDGNSNAGLEHIMQHADQFATKGISADKIPDFIMQAIEDGKVVGTQRTRTIYEVMYEGKLQRVAISVGDNGFIVGANPKSIP